MKNCSDQSQQLTCWLQQPDLRIEALSHFACLTGEIDGALFEGCASVETFAPPGRQP
jgi:hypothetical protein